MQKQTNNIFYNIAQCYGHLNKKQEQLEYSKQSYDIFKQVYTNKEHSLQYADCIYGYAYALGVSKNYQLQLKLALESFQIYQKVYKDKGMEFHPRWHKILMFLSFSYSKMKFKSEAKTFKDQAFDYMSHHRNKTLFEKH